MDFPAPLALRDTVDGSHPDREAAGQNPLQLDSSAARAKVQEFLLTENRFKMLTKSRPEEAKRLFELAQTDADTRWQLYSYMASRTFGGNGNGDAKVAADAK